MAEPIMLYLDALCTMPYIVEPTDFSAFTSSSSSNPNRTATITIGEETETLTYYSNAPNNVNYSLYPDGTRIASTVTGNVHLIDTTYYIKPNMSVQVKLDYDDPDDPDSPYRFSVKYQFNGSDLTGFSHSETFPRSYNYTLHVGLFKVGRTAEAAIGFYLRKTNRTIRYVVVSENYWNGSLKVPSYQSSTPSVTPQGHKPQGNINKGTEDFVDYAFSLDRANASGHGPRLYVVSDAAIDALYTQLWSPDMWTQWKSVKYNLFGGILSWHKLPCVVPYSATVQRITVNGQAYDLGTSVGIASNDKIRVTFISDLIPEIFGGYLDYGRYTSAALYLPFIGVHEIDTDRIMGGRVEVAYYIDVYSGNCCAEVRTIDRDGSQTIQGMYTGNCAYKYPLSGSDQGGAQIVGSLVSNAGQAIVAAAAGSPAGVVNAAFNQLNTDLNAQHHAYQMSSFSGNAAALGDMRVKLVLKRPCYLTPANYAQLNGFSAASDGTVSDYQTEGAKTFLIGDIDTAGISGTDEECQMIRAAFRNGVFI